VAYVVSTNFLPIGFAKVVFASQSLCHTVLTWSFLGKDLHRKTGPDYIRPFPIEALELLTDNIDMTHDNGYHGMM
jgi:hypothetical protein